MSNRAAALDDASGEDRANVRLDGRASTPTRWWIKYTIKLTLKTPQADFIDGLVLLSSVPPEVDADLEKKPIGSGPFQFVEWVPNDHITPKRFHGYFEKDVVKVDKLVFKIIPDSQVAITNLRAGAIDSILDVPLTQASTFKSSTAVKAVIQSTSSIHIIELMAGVVSAAEEKPMLEPLTPERILQTGLGFWAGSPATGCWTSTPGG